MEKTINFEIEITIFVDGIYQTMSVEKYKTVDKVKRTGLEETAIMLYYGIADKYTRKYNSP